MFAPRGLRVEGTIARETESVEWGVGLGGKERVVQPVIALDIFQTGVISIRLRKWFTETGQMITVNG